MTATVGAGTSADGASRRPRTFITGGAGFIGAHLARELLARGHEVVALDDLSTGNLDNVADLLEHEDFRLVPGDVRDEQLLDELMAGCDVVFHLAAVVGVQLVVEDALTTLTTNVGGTEAVLRVAHAHGTKVMLASTSEVYGKCVKLPASEDDDVVLGSSRQSRWSYAASKMVDEFLALAYHRQKGLPVVVFRFFNTVGPRQTGRYGMVVPRFVTAALAGKPLPVYGDGNQSRSFLHVHDAVAAAIALSETPEAVGEVFNVGGSKEITIGDLAALVLQMAGRSPEDGIVHVPYDEAYAPGYEDIRRRVADTAKLRRYTGWTVTRDLTDIIADVIADVRAGMPPLPRAEEAVAEPVA